MSDLPNYTGNRRYIQDTAQMHAIIGRPGPGRALEAGDVTDAVWLDLLCEACVDASDDAIARTIAGMQDAGITPVQIAEAYVPAAARIMGDKWCEDAQSFAHVTIGCSRLHGVLRDLGPAWRPGHLAAIDAPSVLVMVAEDIYHTLGATVLSGILRRSGYSVKLWLGAKVGTVADVVQNGDYDAVLLSASSGESLEAVRGIVKAIKSVGDEPPVVILGGTILADGAISLEDALRMTGADHATNDAQKALELCAGATHPRSKNSLTASALARRS